MANLTPAKARRLLKLREAKKFDPQQLLDSAFDQQQAFIKDPAKLKALFCTRRSSKSFTAALYMIYEALVLPGCNCVFIGLTRASARGIIWKDCFKVINTRFKLGAKFNENYLTMTLPNGSVISVLGINDGQDEMNKLLGRKYRVACVDEASMYTIDQRLLVYGILKPAMADVSGTICMMGTASNYTRGLFFDVTTGKERGWSLHSWTAHDNPHVARQWQAELDEITTLRPLFMETPLFKQWYMNEWVVNTDLLVYKFNENKNLYKQMPLQAKGDWTYILGVDTGWEDDTAFVLSAYHEHDKCLYIVDTFNKKKMTFDDVIAKVQEYMLDVHRMPAKVVIDGANKQGVESMKLRSSIPFEYADKMDKATFIELLNNDLIQARIKINAKCETLVDELMGLIWKADPKDDTKIAIPKREHPGCANHLCDAFLYAWRMGFHYGHVTVEKKVAVGSREWFLKQSQLDDKFWEAEREKTEEQEKKEKGDGSGWDRFSS